MLSCRAAATEAVGAVCAAAPGGEVRAALPDIMGAAFQARATARRPALCPVANPSP